MRKVAIVRADYPVISEPFISEQLGAMLNWRPIIIRRRSSTITSGFPVADVTPVRGRFAGLIPQVPSRTHIAAAAACDLLHSHFGPDGVYAAALSRRSDIPFLVTYHGYDVTLNNSSLLRSCRPSKIHYLAFRRKVFQRSAHSIAVSNFVRRRLIDLGCPPSTVTTHYIGVDVDAFHPRCGELSERGLRLLSVSRLVNSKALDTSIAAVAELIKHGRDLTYTIVGDGPLKTDLSRLISRLGVASNVRLVGAQEHSVVKSLMSDADIFLFPSRRCSSGAEEALGIAPLEAAASGLPVVACDAGGITETVIHGKTGFIADCDNTLQFTRHLDDLCTHASLRQAMGSAGRRMVERKFNLRVQTQLLEEIYDDIAGSYSNRSF